MADIDELKFSIILDDSKFTKKMKEVEELAGKFEKSVKEALDATKKLDKAQNGGVDAEEKKAKAAATRAKKQQELLKLTREELEMKKQMGTITNAELSRLNALIRHDKTLAQEEKNQLDIQKKKLDVESKTLTIQKKKEDAERRHAAAVESTNEKVRKQSLLMQQVTSYISTYLSIYGGISLVRNIVRITGEFEAQRAALRAILQDAAGADRIFYQLQELAVKSPYTFRDLTSYAKQLSAFSVPMNEIYDTTKKLADVSAGLGVDMSRIILAYGQVRSAAFLRGQEVRQFTEAGIPILAELAKQFEEIEGHAVSTGEVFDRISKRQVPFEMVEEAFRRMTAEGGKFYNMQEVLAATVKGKISNLQDSWEIMLSKIGDANSGLIKGSLSLLTELIKNYEKLGAVILEVTVAYGAYKATLAATNALQSAAAVSTRFLAVTGERVTSLEVLAHRLFRTTESGLVKIGKFIAKNPYAIAIAAVAAGITGLILHLRKMNEHLRETDKITAKAIGQAEASKSNIHYYIQRLKEAKEGTEEYNKARQAVIDQAGNYISATDAERLSLQNVDDVWVNICKHIEEATKLQAMQSVTADAAARKQAAQLQAMDDLASYQLSNGLTNETRMDIASFIRGEIDKDTLRERLLAAGIFNPTYNYRGQEYEIISKGSLADVVSHAETWALAYAEAEGIYNESIQRAQQNMNDLYAFVGPQPSEEKKALEGWRARVKEFIDTVDGGDRGMKIDDATSLSSYIKKGAEALNDARESLKHTPKDDADYAKLEKEIEFYETISEKIYGAGNTEFDNTTKKFKKDAKDQIATLRQYFADLKSLKSEYDNFKALGFSDEQIGGILSIPAVGFGKAFENLALKAEGLGDKGLAGEIRRYSSGKDISASAKSIDEAQKAVEKFQESLEDLQATTRRLNLEGFAAELDKILVDTDSKNRKLRMDWDQKERELEKQKDGWIAEYRIKNEKATVEEAEKAWSNFFDKQKEEAKKSIDEQIAYNNKSAQIQIDKKADAWVKNMLDREGVELTDWADKTPEQIERIKTKLQELKDKLPGLIPETLQEDADKIEVTFDNLLKLIEQILSKKIDTANLEAAKKDIRQIAKDAKTIGSYLGKIGSSISKLSGIWGDFEGIGNAFTIAGNTVTSLYDLGEKLELGQMSSGGFVASSFMLAAENIVDATTTAIDCYNKLKEAEKQWTMALKETDYELENLYISSFGYKRANVFDVESPYSKALAASKQLQAAQEKLLAHTQELADIQVKTGQKEVLDAGSAAEIIASTTAAGAAIGAAFAGYGAIIGAAVGLIVGGITAAFSSKKYVDVFESIGKLTGGMIFDPETLELTDEVLARLGQMDDEGKVLIEQWKEIKEVMREALDSFNENVESVVGDIGQGIKDTLVEAFNNNDVYGAIDNLHDYIGDMIQSLMIEIAFSKALQPIFDELEKDMRHSFGIDANGNPLTEMDDAVDYSWTDDLAKFNRGLNDALPLWQQAMSEAQTATEALGYNWNYGSDSTAGESLGSGIKSVTEDTANLLASYINAIRADVSYGRIQWERIAVAVEGQAGQYITLNDYMAQVAANTFDTAQNTQRILGELQSVIGAEGSSGSIVRVQMA